MLIQKRSILYFAFVSLLLMISTYMYITNHELYFGSDRVVSIQGKDELRFHEREWASIDFEYCFDAKLNYSSMIYEKNRIYTVIKLAGVDEYIMVVANDEKLEELQQMNYFSKSANAKKEESGKRFLITGFVEKINEKDRETLIELIRKYSISTYEKSQEMENFDEAYLLPNKEANTNFDYVLKLFDPATETKNGKSIRFFFFCSLFSFFLIIYVFIRRQIKR